MVPSDPVESASSVQKKAFARREKDRKKRFENLRVLCLSKKFMYKMAMRLNIFVEGGGLVDKLDTEPIFGEECMEPDRDLDVIVENLKQFQVKLEEMSLQAVEEDYTFEYFDQDIKRCYQHEVLEDNLSLRLRIAYRMNRFIGKFLIPICEANSRGVTQSSIWGNIAAVIWARESSKKPYWPALCLGMLPPDDQREDWHAAITERNESRLPEKLNAQLMTTKKKCEQAQKRQSLSYFLVEFLGTHEFIWVRETDIVEKFDPADDPNKNASHAPKKKRSSRSSSTSIVGSKTYATALEECGWAQEEYESTLADAFDDACNDKEEQQEDDDEEEMNYSFALLAQSDDEADDEDGDDFQYDESNMSLSDVDEANWLLTHEGKLDTSVAGRKNTKKRTLALKKKTAVKEKKVQVETAKKAKVSPAKKKTKTKVKAKVTKKDSRSKDREEKRELRDLEKRRRKRQREREKVLRVEARKQKRRRTPTYDSDDNDRGLNRDKRARATAIVKGYLTRAVNKDEYKSLGLAGVMTIPAAMVDSTGLLGMALAFRAAAGELNMPDENPDDAKTKPWKAIDSESPKASSERAENLTKQIKLLEAEMERAENDAQKRKELAEEAVARRLSTDVEITADDVAARQNHFKKKKKVLKVDHTSIDESLEKAGSGQHENGIETTNGDAVDEQKAQIEPSVAADETLEETNDEEAMAQVDSEEVMADAEPADNDTPVVDN
jgi:ferric iron reductase protein FhuF